MNRTSGLFIATALVLLLGLLPLPAGVVLFQKFLVSGTCTFGAFLASEKDLTGWLWVLVGLAVLFNPFVHLFPLDPSGSLLNVVAAIVLVAFSTRLV